MYREVTMIELKEVLRLRGEGLPKRRLTANLGLEPKTVRRYLSVAASVGVQAGAGPVTDEQLRDVLLALHPTGGRPRGDSWDRCVTQRMAIERWLRDGLRLTKIRKLLARQDVVIPYPTLHRFAVLELQFGRTASTIPVLDGEPGQDYGEWCVTVRCEQVRWICDRAPTSSLPVRSIISTGRHRHPSRRHKGGNDVFHVVLGRRTRSISRDFSQSPNRSDRQPACSGSISRRCDPAPPARMAAIHGLPVGRTWTHRERTAR